VSKPITKTLQERLKMHMAIFTLLSFLVSGFDIRALDEIPVTRLIIIIYVGLLMMWAFIVDARRPTKQVEEVKDTLRILYLDLRKLFGENREIRMDEIAEIEKRMAELQARIEGLNVTAPVEA